MAVNPCGNSTNLTGGGANLTINNSSGGCGCGGCGGGGAAGGSGGVLPPELGGPPVSTGHGGGGTGGATGGGPGGSPGSGDGGAINPDGGDIQIVPSKCIDLQSPPNEAFGHEGFELANLDITQQVKDAVAAIPGWQADSTIVSAKVSVSGLAWTGFSIAGGPLTPNRKLTTVDTSNNTRQVAFTEERGGISLQGVGVSTLSYRYNDTYSLDMTGPNPVKIDGQFPRSPIAIDGPGGADKDSPAWLKASVCSAIIRKKSSAVVFDFDRWSSANVPFGPDLLADKYRVAGFKLNAAQEGWHGPFTTGDINYPQFVWPINDSSNYGHYWPIIMGQKPIAAGKTKLHLAGVYGTGASGLIMTARFFEQNSSDPAAPYVDLGGIGEIDFAVTGPTGTVYGFDINFTYPTIGQGLWYVQLQINGYNFGLWDLKGAFS